MQKMVSRVDILGEFTSHLRSASYTDAPLPSNGVQRGFKYIDQINDFPYICYHVDSSELIHIGANERYYNMTIALRAYVRGEDSQALSDQLALDIEDAIDNFRDAATSTLQVSDARILEVSTDEGLMEPNGVVDMVVSVSYQQDVNI
jgi:hypothetical protein